MDTSLYNAKLCVFVVVLIKPVDNISFWCFAFVISYFITLSSLSQLSIQFARTYDFLGYKQQGFTYYLDSFCRTLLPPA